MLAVRSHLRDVRSDERRLNDQVNLAGTLHDDLSVGRAIFLSDAGRGERCVLELNINFARIERTATRLFTIAISCGVVSFSQWRQKSFNFY